MKQINNGKKFAGAALAALALLGTSAHAQTIYQWGGTLSTDWGTAGNWNAGTVGAVGTTYDARLNVYNGANSKLIYSATQGTTVYANSTGRGLVISSATGAVAGSMEITGGSFSTLGSTGADVIGNAANGTLTVSGGSFIGAGTAAGGTIVGLNSGSGTSTLTLSGSGSATVTKLQLAAATAIVNLNGGTLTANEIVDVDNSGVSGNSNTTFNFGGGTLKAGTGAVTAFMTGLTQAYVLSGGAKIDTNGKDITIGQALLAPVSGTSGGLTKLNSGTLTLTGINTNTGDTSVDNGTLALADNAGLKFVIGGNGVNNKITGSGSGTLTLAGDFTFDLSGADTTVGNSWTIVDLSNVATTFNPSSFTVNGFTPVGSDLWTQALTGTTYYRFSETTGRLQVIPEPSTLTLVGLGLLGAVAMGRRFRRTV